jgi:meiotically up-regulated gene 157 (Mug157) protein
VYAATREFVWSTQNPWFFSGKAGEGIGGPHVGFNSIWPMSIIMKALTTDDTTEIQACLMTLLEATASTGLMHESFDKDDSSSYTRPWFAWANSLFGELIMKVYSEEQHRGFLYNAKRISVQ